MTYMMFKPPLRGEGIIKLHFKKSLCQYLNTQLQYSDILCLAVILLTKYSYYFDSVSSEYSLFPGGSPPPPHLPSEDQSPVEKIKRCI